MPVRRSPLSRVVAVLAALAAVATLAACDPPPAPDSVLIPCSAKDERVVITRSSHLDPSCVYTAGFEITASDVTLDCRRAVLRPSGTVVGAGILIRTPVDVALADVRVTRCRVEGGGRTDSWTNSLKITRDGFRSLPEGEEFVHPTSDIVLEDNVFTGSRGVGVFVDGYVSDVTIRRNSVVGAGSSGIYLETGSKQNTVEGNHLDRNGFIENGPDGRPFDLNGTSLWFWGVGREGISVDGSYENTIRANVFTGNSAGGIFLYKNCGEYPDRNPGRWFERRDPADRNLIEGNLFFGGRNGIWVGSRMGENVLPMECSDPKYVDSGGRQVVLDRAADNVLRDNRFFDVTYGVRVEDDGTTVEGNEFTSSSPAHHAVIVGTPDRTTVLGRPVARTVLRDNRAAIPGNAHPYRWVHGQVDTVESGNTAHGAPAALCQGQPPPRQIFVMVIAVKLANPDGSMPAPPDLTVPTLGALPACT